MNTTQQTKSPLAIKRYRNKLLKNLRAAQDALNHWQWTPNTTDEQERIAVLELRADILLAEQALAAETDPCDGEAHSNGFIDHCMSCLNCTWGRVWKASK